MSSAANATDGWPLASSSRTSGQLARWQSETIDRGHRERRRRDDAFSAAAGVVERMGCCSAVRIKCLLGMSLGVILISVHDSR